MSTTAGIYSIVGATGTGAGKALELSNGEQNYAAYLSFGAGAGALTVAIQVLMPDRTTWVTALSHTCSAGELAAGTAVFNLVGYPAKDVRLNITTYTTAGTVNGSIYAVN